MVDCFVEKHYFAIEVLIEALKLNYLMSFRINKNLESDDGTVHCHARNDVAVDVVGAILMICPLTIIGVAPFLTCVSINLLVVRFFLEIEDLTNRAACVSVEGQAD